MKTREASSIGHLQGSRAEITDQFKWKVQRRVLRQEGHRGILYGVVGRRDPVTGMTSHHYPRNPRLWAEVCRGRGVMPPPKPLPEGAELTPGWGGLFVSGTGRGARGFTADKEKGPLRNRARWEKTCAAPRKAGSEEMVSRFEPAGATVRPALTVRWALPGY